MSHPAWQTWNGVHAYLSCFKCGSRQLNIQESTGQNGGPANAPGDGEHRSQCGECGLYTYFDVTGIDAFRLFALDLERQAEDSGDEEGG